MAWDKFTVQLDPNKDWTNTPEGGPCSVWGNGNGGQDLWGWPSGGTLEVDGPLPNGQITISLITPGASDRVAWTMRLMREGTHPEVAGGMTEI
jgi:hypothetical protein